MIKNKKAIYAAALISAATALFGCSKTSESDVVKVNSANQSTTISNINNVAANNGVAANSPVAAPTPLNPNASMPTPANREKNASPSVKMPTPQIGSGGDDFSVFTQVRGALNAEKEFVEGVIVAIKEGNVTLTGNVSSQAQKTKAAQLTQTVKGVKSVTNNLHVSP